MADSKQTDEELGKQEAPVEPPEETPKEETPEEPSQDIQEEPAPEEQPAEPEVPEEPAEKPPSRREQLRVQQLLKKYGPPKKSEPQKSGKDYRDMIQADDEVYQTLESDRQNVARDSYNQGQEAANFGQWRRFLQYDERQAWNKYPELDPSNKDRYHSALADAMQAKYLRAVGYDGEKNIVADPDMSYLDFVEAEMEFADEVASLKVADTTKNIAKQAASTGLRPDGSSAKGLDLNKAPEDMDKEELEAAINASMPRDSRGRFIKSTSQK